MNVLQQAEFDILKVFDSVCRKLKLTYFLVCGSALGAVKYQGFIPWDDDIDVAMYREDYERFCREAPQLLPTNLFLQNFHSEPAFPQIYSKLRNSNTTYIEKTAARLPINHGVFIDIFPLDGYPKGKIGGMLTEFFKRLYGSMLLAAYDLPDGGTRKIWRLLGFHRHPQYVARALDRLIRRWSVAESELICNHGNWQGTLDYSPAEVFGHGTHALFEGLAVLVPSFYDQYLRRKYGDYTIDLPLERMVGHHYYSICDCRRPFTYYLTEQMYHRTNGATNMNKTQKKGLSFLVTVLAVAVAAVVGFLSGVLYSSGRESTNVSSKQNPVHIPVQTQTPIVDVSVPFEEDIYAIPEDTERPDLEIETPYLTLFYPGRWEEHIHVESVSLDFGMDVIFYSLLGGEKYWLFTVHFAGSDGLLVGPVETPEGYSLDVTVEMSEFIPDDSWSSRSADLYCAMQEDMNHLIAKIMEDPAFVG